MSLPNQLRRWVKSRHSPAARAIYAVAYWLRHASMPVVPGLHRTLYHVHNLVKGSTASALRIAWYTPLFQSRLVRPAPRLMLYGGMPLVTGPLAITLGDDCRVSAASTFSGRTITEPPPRLTVGRNVDIGWQTTIAVGRTVTIGDNVRIAGRAFIAGYPGHPIDSALRASGAPDTEDQVGDILIEDDVWLATGVTVLAGVRIGRGTIVAAGSVVTKDLPPFVLAGGTPARPLRRLPEGAADIEKLRRAS